MGLTGAEEDWARNSICIEANVIVECTALGLLPVAGGLADVIGRNQLI